MYECEQGHATKIVADEGNYFLCIWAAGKEPLHVIRIDTLFSELFPLEKAST